MDEQERKQMYKKTFNTVAEGYDNDALRFFTASAGLLSSFLDLQGDEHILDVATGTGNAALTIAQKLTRGRVTGIDFAENMLGRARRKQAAWGIDNVNFLEMDMQAIAFPDQHFDAAVSAFSIFFVENMEKQLAHIATKVKPGGRIIVTSFYETAFSPLVDIFFKRLGQYNIDPPPLTWKRIATEEKGLAILNAAGLKEVCCHRRDVGYYLPDADGWWNVVWNGGFRGLVSQLSPTDLEKFKEEHLCEINELATDQGIRLDVQALFLIGRV